MPATLRTRRSTSTGSVSSASTQCSSLPLFADSIYDTTEISISSCFEEDEYPIQEFRPEHSKGKNKCWESCRAALLRSLVVVAIFCTLSHNLRNQFQSQSRIDNATMFNDIQEAPAAAAATPAVPTAEATLQQESKALLLHKFGAGPHLVEFQLQIWGEQDNRPVDHYFTVELAPVQLMPVTTLYFLEQVASGLWSGASFYINAEHVIMARPVNGNGQLSKRKDFAESPHGTVPFVEYSALYPHLPFTLGFTAPTADQPSSFYINKKYNPQHAREACFGQVVVGRPTIEKIAQMQGYAHDPTRIRPVDIVAVRQVSLQQLSESAAKEYLSVKSSQGLSAYSR